GLRGLLRPRSDTSTVPLRDDRHDAASPPARKFAHEAGNADCQTVADPPNQRCPAFPLGAHSPDPVHDYCDCGSSGSGGLEHDPTASATDATAALASDLSHKLSEHIQ